MQLTAPVAMLRLMNEAVLTLTPAQTQFVARHRATVGAQSLVNPRRVFVYRDGPDGTWRWLVDSFGTALQATYFR